MLCKCKKCGNWFPKKTFIDGKEIYLHTRSYCLDCSPRGSKNGYNIRKSKTFEKYKANGITSYSGIIKQCSTCNRQFSNSKNDVCTTCRSWHQRHKKRLRAITLLGGKCITCGCIDNEVLTFHHSEKDKKKFNLSANWGNKNWSLIENEIRKCELLCFNCHQKLHIREKNHRHKRILDYYKSQGRRINQYH